MYLIKHAVKFSCPCCTTMVPWTQRSKFLHVFGRRRPGQCPNCQAWIIWDQWSHRFMVSGLAGMLGLILLDGAGYSSVFGRELFIGLFAGAIGCIVLGYIKLRFVRNDPKHPCPPEPSSVSPSE